MNLNYCFPAQLMKAGKEENGRIPIEIIPSEPCIDRVNDKIILKAFEEAREEFLDDGIIDYDHKSVLGKNDLEKAQAIIGEPSDLFIDKKRNVPVCHAYLFKGNPFVDTVIMPHLNNSSTVFGASVGGKILQKSFETDPDTKKEVNTISKILLKHIAVTPRQRAVNPRTSVQLLKSFGNNEVNLILPNFDDLMKSLQDSDFLAKTLIAGSVTDISGISGGQAIQGQSLEGSLVNRNKVKQIIPFVLEEVTKGKLKNLKQWLLYLQNKGLTEKEAMVTVQLLTKNKTKIAELI